MGKAWATCRDMRICCAASCTRKDSHAGGGCLRALIAAVLLAVAGGANSPKAALAPVAGIRTAAHVMAFSFDDGPSLRDTLRIAELLRANGARATFFMTGIMVQQNPSVVRRLRAAGMEIANHGMRHRFLRGLSVAAITQEVTDGERAIQRAGGPHTHLYRLPGGIYDQAALRVVRGLGYSLIGWSVDPKDWPPHAAASAVAHGILSGVAPGRIVLMHDGPGSRDATLGALRTVLPTLRAQGYRIVSVSDLLNSASTRAALIRDVGGRGRGDREGTQSGRLRAE